MSMNLYLKYRPKTIEELDLFGVRRILGEIIKADKTAHAYLLTGPRGSGKTSTARVLARIVNCEKNGNKLGEPCNLCPACESILTGNAVDVIEIDAASNRGIDDIRDLKDKIRLSPAYLRTKVYIIDEVHMLTTEAFNALLKTLEEPPSHSLFILCTTELHKVPATIVSRCVQIQFTKATAEEMQRSLRRVIEGEQKQVSPEALQYLAMSVDGSFRDGVKILDQAMSSLETVGLAAMQEIVSGSVGFSVVPLLEALLLRDGAAALARLDESIQVGVDLTYLLVSLMRGLRDRLVGGQVGREVAQLIFALDDVAARLATGLDGELLIQTTIVEWCGVGEKSEPAEGQKIQKIGKLESQPQSAKLSLPQGSELGQSGDGGEVWQKLLGSLNGESVTLGAILSKAIPADIQGDVMRIKVAYELHKAQLMGEKTLGRLEAIVAQLVGRPIKIKCEVVALPTAVQTQMSAENDIIQDAMAIFNN